MSELFTTSDIPILIQWFAMLLAAGRLMGEVRIEDDDYTTLVGCTILMLIIGYSLYDDIILYYKIFAKSLPDEKMSFIEMLNFHPIVGFGRCIAFIGLAATFHFYGYSNAIVRVIKTIFLIICAIAAAVSLPFALL